MGINKFVYEGETKFDISADTVVANKLLSGYTAHDKNGDSITGTCTYDANTQDGTASTSDILTGKKAYVKGAAVSGEMVNNGAVSGTISTVAGQYTVPTGYHDGSGKVSILSTEQAKIIATNIKHGVSILGVTGSYAGDSTEKPQANKNATPSASEQIILPDDGYTCLSQVTVKAIPYTESTTTGTTGITITIG